MSAPPFTRWRSLPPSSSRSHSRTTDLEWVHPEFPLAHPLDDGTAAVLERSVDATAAGLGPDARAYRRLMGPLVSRGRGVVRRPARTLSHSAPTYCRRAVRAQCHPLREGTRGCLVPRRSGAGSHRGPGGARGVAARTVPRRGDHPHARVGRACGWLAVPARRFTADRRCAGLVLPLAWRRDHHRLACGLGR